MNTILDKAYEEMGIHNEENYKPIIQEIYGSVIKTNFKYCKVDFFGKNFCGELKSRDLSINDFYETMIGYNKIEEGFKKLNLYKEQNYKVYLWFAFKEGLFVWELNESNYELNGGNKQKRMGGTCNRGYDDYKEHYYIKKENMIKINDTPVWIHPLVAENTRKKYEKIRRKSSIPVGVCLLPLNKLLRKV
jgi:hypothetical protein